MATTASTARQFTIDDLANFPDDGNHYEVIEGELYMSAAPGHSHQRIIVALTVALELWRRAGGGGCPGARYRSDLLP